MYVDGFVLPVPKKNLRAYLTIAKKASKIFREHGAVGYYEAPGDDLDIKGMLSFRKMAKCKPSETVVFAWVLYKSRAQRDAANAKIMSDPRLAQMMSGEKCPFDMKKMAYGGFKVMVKA